MGVVALQVKCSHDHVQTPCTGQGLNPVPHRWVSFTSHEVGLEVSLCLSSSVFPLFSQLLSVLSN